MTFTCFVIMNYFDGLGDIRSILKYVVIHSREVGSKVIPFL